jgi:hypothetical protein
MPSTLALTSVSPSTSEAQGGEVVTLTGTFPPGKTVKVYVGPLGSSADPACYSGVCGKGNTYLPASATSLDIFLPRLDPGTYSIYAVSGTDNDVLAGALTVTPRQFRSTVHAMRSIMPPKWAVGPRTMEMEP